jgi:predicted RNase H-like HicB family nuclease
MKLFARIEIFREGDSFVALSPELNVSSFGDTVEEAKASIKEAIQAFVEECERMGTLEDVLEESGFSRVDDSWHSRELIEEENLAIAL